MKKLFAKLVSAGVILALALGLFPLQATPVQAASASVVISQVYGGGGNSGATLKNDFIELYNLGSSPVDVTGWTVQYASSAGTSWQKTALNGLIEPGKYFLVQEAQGAGGTVDLPAPNAVGTIAMSATAGKVALVNNSTTLTGSCPTGLVDLVGFGSATNCSETAPTVTLSNTTAALRNGNGAVDTDNNSADFTVGAPNPRNTPPPDSAPTVASTVPADGASSVPYDTNVTVTFSEPVNVTSAWYTLSCSISGSHTAVFSGGPTTFTINPDTDFVSGDSCTLTVLANQVSDVDSNDPPDNMVANFTVGFSTTNACTLSYTPIYDIQGSGSTAAVTGIVTTQGVVISDNEGPSPALRGFYLQDLSGDDNTATSDGIFVFNGNNNNVTLGDVVRVSGKAEEYQGQTQISSVTSIINCGTGSVNPIDVTLPFTSADQAEQYEGMLVRFPQTLTVTETYQLGRFDEVLLSSGGRLQQPTNVTTPGAAANTLQAHNNLNQILVDDASQAQNPDPILFGRGGQPLSASNTLRGGDTAKGIVGVMTYTWGGSSTASPNAYRVRPINALGGSINFEPSNPRPAEAPALSGRLRVVGMNLLNFFNTINGCTNGVGGAATDCRGAEDETEFARQWPKTVAAITGTQADVIGVTEMENDGYRPDSAIQFLVDKLNAATAPATYAFIDADAGTGQVNALGLDAIKVGLIYKTAKVTPVGKTAALNTDAFVNGGDSTPRNRAALAQAFEEVGTGARFVVSVNHLKSKGSTCAAPDAGDGQGNCNIVRTNAANALTAWLASDPTGTNDPDALIIGDLNSYAMEDPITAIKSAGYTDLANKFEGSGAYSYVFDGMWGYLDHALSNASLTPQVTGVTDWHINSDEPSVLDYNTNFKTANLISSLYAQDFYRVADHDPVLIDLNPKNDPPTASAGGPYSAKEGETVTLSATGSDPDGTPVSFAWDLDNNGTFETAGQTAQYTVVDEKNANTVPVQVTDATGLSTTATATVNVANVAPALGAIMVSPTLTAVNSSVSASTTFTDPGVLDTHTSTIDWGDGSTSAGTVTETSGSGSVSGTHAYKTAGLYQIILTVTDIDGDSASSTSETVVVYNPQSSTANGSGWITSLAGAYPQSTTLTGKAAFSFSAKYVKGATVPTGTADFQFYAANMVFHATSFQWLVVTGTEAQIKGTGTINGAGSYSFTIYAADGAKDTFRMKIWDNAGVIVYDNLTNQPLGGGNITVHK